MSPYILVLVLIFCDSVAKRGHLTSNHIFPQFMRFYNYVNQIEEQVTTESQDALLFLEMEHPIQ